MCSGCSDDRLTPARSMLEIHAWPKWQDMQTASNSSWSSEADDSSRCNPQFLILLWISSIRSSGGFHSHGGTPQYPQSSISRWGFFRTKTLQLHWGSTVPPWRAGPSPSDFQPMEASLLVAVPSALAGWETNPRTSTLRNGKNPRNSHEILRNQKKKYGNSQNLYLFLMKFP